MGLQASQARLQGLKKEDKLTKQTKEVLRRQKNKKNEQLYLPAKDNNDDYKKQVQSIKDEMQAIIESGIETKFNAFG